MIIRAYLHKGYYSVIFLLLISLFYGCSIQEKRKPDFVIEGSHIRYHGLSLPLVENIDTWLKNIGKPTRHIIKIANELYVWDSLGFLCYVDQKTKKVGSLVIAFRPQDLDFWPKNCFAGCISVDGALIDGNTPIMDFNKNKKGQRFREAYFPSIYDYYVDGITDYYVRIDLDDLGNIAEFSISTHLAEK